MRAKAEAAKTFTLLQDLQTTRSANAAEVEQLQSTRDARQAEFDVISSELKGLMEQHVDEASIIENSHQLPGDGALDGVKVELFTGNDQGRHGFIPHAGDAA
jgi:hypothetical protein